MLTAAPSMVTGVATGFSITCMPLAAPNAGSTNTVYVPVLGRLAKFRNVPLTDGDKVAVPTVVVPSGASTVTGTFTPVGTVDCEPIHTVACWPAVPAKLRRPFWPLRTFRP